MNASIENACLISANPSVPNDISAGELTSRRRRVVYFLYGIASFGQLVAEVFWLRNIFDQPENLFTIITHPPTDRVNRACYDFVMRGIDVHHIPNYCLPKDGRGIHEVNRDIHVMEDCSWLENSFPVKVYGRKPSFIYSLTPEDTKQGQRCMARFGIPAEAPIVVLHNRESGWQPTLTYHSYRNADIERYLPAVEYLLSRGYYVIRIGDKTMKPLPRISDRLYDMPFHPMYTPSVELYCTAMCRFFVSVPSGPLSFAVAFNKPVMWVNSPIVSYLWGNPQDILIPKKYYSHRLKRYLAYSEIVTSPLLDFCRTEQFSRFGVELQENTPEEILLGVQEMESRISGTYDSTGSALAIDTRVRQIHRIGHRYCQHARERFPWFSMALSQMRVGHEFVKTNPWFLDQHQWD